MSSFLKNRGLDKLEQGLEKKIDPQEFFTVSKPKTTNKSHFDRSQSLEIVKAPIEAELKNLEPYEKSKEISYFKRKRRNTTACGSHRKRC